MMELLEAAGWVVLSGAGMWGLLHVTRWNGLYGRDEREFQMRERRDQ